MSTGLDAVTVQFGLFYNKAIIDAAGVTTLPTTPRSGSALATQLTQRPNQFGMFSDHLLSEPESFWFTLQNWANVYEGLWAEGKTPLLTSEPILQTLTLFKQFYDATFPQGTNGATATRLWGSGQIAQQLIVSAAVNVYKDQAPELYPNIRSYSFPWAEQEDDDAHPPADRQRDQRQEGRRRRVRDLGLQAGELPRVADPLARRHPRLRCRRARRVLQPSSRWLEGYKDAVAITPPEMVGDFIFNNQEFGRIVITRFSEVLTTGRPVEEAMADAQREAEELAQRLEE